MAGGAPQLSLCLPVCLHPMQIPVIGWAYVKACNREDKAAGGWRLPPPPLHCGRGGYVCSRAALRPALLGLLPRSAPPAARARLSLSQAQDSRRARRPGADLGERTPLWQAACSWRGSHAGRGAASAIARPALGRWAHASTGNLRSPLPALRGPQEEPLGRPYTLHTTSAGLAVNEGASAAAVAVAGQPLDLQGLLPCLPALSVG